MTTIRRLALTLAAAACAALTSAGSAAADDHLIKIRQIHPSTGMFGGEWVELQMYADGQNLVSGNVIRTFDPDGAQMSIYTIQGGDPPNGQSQGTILISSLFTPAGVDADFVAPVADLQMTGQDGAVCYSQGNAPTYTPIDCVAYGAFTGSIPSAGTPAVATPFEATLERRITPNCPTLLEGADDTNNSSVDFALSTRPPRNNDTGPTEIPCGPGGVPVRCGGLKATNVGSKGPDLLRGGPKRDVIAGRAGNDRIRGLGRGDVLCGGKGRDRLIGGKGRDRLFGGPGRDRLKGGPGKDMLRGGPGKNVQIQ